MTNQDYPEETEESIAYAKWRDPGGLYLSFSKHPAFAKERAMWGRSLPEDPPQDALQRPLEGRGCV